MVCDMAGRILVVEDEAAIRSFIEQALSDAGYKVFGVENGIDALSLLERWEPDVILLDLWMPVMDGWQFIDAYRHRPGPHAPLIAMTAVVDGGGAPKQLEAADYLEKPFDTDDLLDRVARFTPPEKPPAQAVH